MSIGFRVLSGIKFIGSNLISISDTNMMHVHACKVRGIMFGGMHYKQMLLFINHIKIFCHLVTVKPGLHKSQMQNVRRRNNAYL